MRLVTKIFHVTLDYATSFRFPWVFLYDIFRLKQGHLSSPPTGRGFQVRFNKLGLKEHILTSYGDEVALKTPKEIYDEDKAKRALDIAKKAICSAQFVISAHGSVASPNSPEMKRETP